jgi:hypothetical protein
LKSEASTTAKELLDELAAEDELELATLLDELAPSEEDVLELMLDAASLLTEELAEDTALEAADEILEEEDEAAPPPDPPPPQASKALVSKTRLRDFPVRARGILNSPLTITNCSRSIVSGPCQIKIKTPSFVGY